MKKKIVFAMSILIAIFLIVIFAFRATIFQRGNPLPYVAKMLTLNNNNHYSQIFNDEDVYITKKGDFDELHEYIKTTYKIPYFKQMGSGFTYSSNAKTVILTSEIYFKNYEVWQFTIKNDER